jgi:hypothetical protein
MKIKVIQKKFIWNHYALSVGKTLLKTTKLSSAVEMQSTYFISSIFSD